MLEHPLIGMVIRKCVFLNFANKDILFRWVPKHIGIRGNEKADSAAKSALDLPRFKVGVPYTAFKQHINQYIISTWQRKIGSLPTGSARRMELFCVLPASVIHI